jgi:hypothetical protein
LLAVAALSFHGGGMGRRGACTLKRVYPTHAAALVVVCRMEEQGYSRSAMRIYECKKGKCRQWHIGHKITKGRKGQR